MDLLNFYAEGKSNYTVYLWIKNDIIQFSLSAIMRINYLTVLQKRHQEKYWVSKKHCRMWVPISAA